METNTFGLLLAAGDGKRMNSSLPKVAHELLGKPLIIWSLESLINAGVKKVVAVISPKHEIVADILSKYIFPKDVQIKISYQDKALGTGHAAQCGLTGLENYFKNDLNDKINILIAYGDTPAVEALTFRDFIKFHETENNNFSILAFKTKNPFGYGRIIQDYQNKFNLIREEKDCTEEEKKIDICNSGFICGKYFDFKKILPNLKNKNAANEYYLTDVPFYSKENNGKIGIFVGEDENEFLGINSQEQLIIMENKLKKKINN